MAVMEGEKQISREKAEILAQTQTHLHIRTQYYQRVQCKDSYCTEKAMPHKHHVYMPRLEPMDRERILNIRYCTHPECPPSKEEEEGKAERHSHNGTDRVMTESSYLIDLPGTEIPETHGGMPMEFREQAIETTSTEESYSIWPLQPEPPRGLMLRRSDQARSLTTQS